MNYLKIEDPNNFFYVDIETNGLKPSLIWCAVIKNKGTKQVWKFINDNSANIYHELRKFFETKTNATYCAHYGLSFDFPHLEFFTGHSFTHDHLVDTVVLSYLYNPALEGGHSLEAYGDKLKFPKVEHTDWTKFSPEMLHRCEVDVDLLELVHDALLKRMTNIGFSELSCEIEHKIRVIIDQQQKNGFWFDKDRGISFLADLRKRESDLAKPIQELFPPTLETLGHYTRRYRKDGSNSASYENHLKHNFIIKSYDDDSYDTLQYKPFNIGSPKQRLERLLGLGYKPTAKTPKGNPKIDEESLLAYAKLCGRPEITAMADWLVHNGRGNMVETWLGYVHEDSRIHGKIISCGATTRRMTHNSPNTANIPSASKALYGHECRALWGVQPGLGLKLVGYDAAGLETVGLCHYLGNLEATKVLLQPKPNDIHTMNSRVLSELLQRPVDREWGAKTSWYAWLYGAYPPKLGSIVKGSASDGDLIIKTFFKNVPGLERLINDVQSEWSQRSGLLRTIDGGFVRCPGRNAALNYKIQSLGAIVMKMASIVLEKEAFKIGLNFKLVGSIHDEGQLECKETDSIELGKLAVASITQAAEVLGFRERLLGDYKIGDTWADTH